MTVAKSPKVRIRNEFTAVSLRETNPNGFPLIIGEPIQVPAVV